MTSQKKWSLQQHKDHLAYLEQAYNATNDTTGFGLALIVAEGAFYFGRYITPAEHVEKYREAIKGYKGE